MKLTLQKSFFDFGEKELLTHGNITVISGRTATGVEILEVKSPRVSFVFTPFKGQQIWHLTVDGEEISMQTEIGEPKNTMTYLENYGGFLYHCGVISFGAPDALHPQHGEIPNAEYGSAYITCSADENGSYIALGGSLEHNTAFVRHYRFSPEIRLYENSTVLKIFVTLENLRSYPLEYMYLCHINFRPFEGAKLYTSARFDADHFKIYENDPSPELAEYIARLRRDPLLHTDVKKDEQCYDPELCFGIVYDGDENGRAYTLQKTGNGACYVSHPTDVLPYAIRWISRTKNEDSMGMVLPCTAEHLGYNHAKETGQLKILPADASLTFCMEAGYLDEAEALCVIRKIEQIAGN